MWARSIRKVAQVLILMFIASCIVAGQHSRPLKVSLCDVLEKPDQYKGNTVSFRAQVKAGLTTPTLVDPNCTEKVALFDFGDNDKPFAKLKRRMNDLDRQERFDKVVYTFTGVWKEIDKDGVLPIKGLVQDYRMTLISVR